MSKGIFFLKSPTPQYTSAVDLSVGPHYSLSLFKIKIESEEPNPSMSDPPPGDTSETLNSFVAPASSCTPTDVILGFKTLDQDRNGEITAVEFIDGLLSNQQLASKFGLHDDILNEYETRAKYELTFGKMDYNHSGTLDVLTFPVLIQRWHAQPVSCPLHLTHTFTVVQIGKLLKRFGHGNLPGSELAGLLTECGYKGNALKAVIDKFAENRERQVVPADDTAVAPAVDANAADGAAVVEVEIKIMIFAPYARF
jgi:hypothetical protein